MTWFAHIAGTFSDAKRDNQCDQLDTELESIDGTLTVLKTGTIYLGLMNSRACLDFEEAEVGTSSASSDHMSVWRQFDPNGVGVRPDAIAAEVRIPNDALASTTATIRYLYAGVLAGDYKVHFRLSKRTTGQTYYHSSSTETIKTLTVAAGDVHEFMEDTVATPAVSAGDILMIHIHRNHQTAGDTANTYFYIFDVFLEYTRTA